MQFELGNTFLISIIMPAFNAELYIEEAIQAALDQTYANIELLVINDGSSDSTKEKILKFEDSRIRYFEQKNLGVSSARNVGLANMRGDYFCFLDADDILPPNSLKSRLEIFQSKLSLSFVDGAVAFKDEKLEHTLRVHKPDFMGSPLPELLNLNDSCFSSLSWMIRRTEANAHIRMHESISHGEDLLYFMELARSGGLYGYTEDLVLNYRQHPASAMKNIEHLENGYWRIYDYIKSWDEFTFSHKFVYRLKVKKFIMLDYLKRGNYKNALSLLFK